METKKNVFYFVIFLISILLITPTLLALSGEISIPSWGDGEVRSYFLGSGEVGLPLGADIQSPTIIISLPEQDSTLAENESLELNFTITDDSPISQCWFKVVDDDNIKINNQIISGCTNTTFDLSDSNFFTLTLYSNDSFDNIGSTIVDFRLSLDKPAVNLNAPDNNIWFDNGNNIYFNYTTTDFDGIDECSLYSNFTGTWKLNETDNFIVSGVEQTLTKNLSENSFIWNINCIDNLGLNDFALSNRTVHVDLTNPNATINTNDNLNVNGKTFTLKYNITDDRNINSCYFTIFDSDGNTHNYGANASLDCSETTRDLSTLSFGDFTLRIWGEDSAGNLDSDLISFTTLDVELGGGGGGGAPIIIGANETLWTMETSQGTGIYQINRIPGDNVILPIILENKGTLEQSIQFNCVDIDGDMCQYVSFEKNNIILEPIKNTKIPIDFNIDIPKDKQGKFIFNIEAVDNFGRKGSLSVELNTDLGFLNTIFTKLLLSSSKFLYLLLFIVLAFGFGYVFDKGISRKLVENKGSAAIMSVFFGVGVSLIIIGLPFI